MPSTAYSALFTSGLIVSLVNILPDLSTSRTRRYLDIQYTALFDSSFFFILPFDLLTSVNVENNLVLKNRNCRIIFTRIIGWIIFI